MFLEAEISEVNENTADSVKVLRDIIENILEFREATTPEELIEKERASLKTSFIFSSFPFFILFPFESIFHFSALILH